MISNLLVGLGGFFGAITRFKISQFNNKNRYLPITLFINVIGSFLLGVLFYLNDRGLILVSTWHLLGVGFLGSFTTFSTFGVELMEMVFKKQIKKALIYVISSITLTILFAYMGMILSRIIV